MARPRGFFALGVDTRAAMLYIVPMSQATNTERATMTTDPRETPQTREEKLAQTSTMYDTSKIIEERDAREADAKRFDLAGTARIEGRDFAVTEGEADFETAMSKYGEITLRGVRGARYISERWHGTQTMRFYNDRLGRSRLPGMVFDGQAFVVTEGTEGDQITLRPATQKENVAAWKIMRSDQTARTADLELQAPAEVWTA